LVVDKSKFSEDIRLFIAHSSAKGEDVISISQWKSMLIKHEEYLAHREDPDKITAKNGLELNFILTAPGSFAGHVKKGTVHEWREVVSYTRTGRRRYADRSYDALYWGTVICDEAHISPSITLAILKGLMGKPYVWAVSGTPYKTTPTELKPFLTVIWRYQRKDRYQNRYQTLLKSIDPLGKEHKSIVNEYQKLAAQKSAETPEIVAKMDELAKKTRQLLLNFMIRRTADSKWK